MLYSPLIASHSAFIEPVIRRSLHQLSGVYCTILAGYHEYPAGFCLQKVVHGEGSVQTIDRMLAITLVSGFRTIWRSCDTSSTLLPLHVNS